MSVAASHSFQLEATPLFQQHDQGMDAKCLRAVLCLAVLMPGYFAQAMDGLVVTQTVICPQGYYCPGGSTNSSFAPPPGGNRRLLQTEVDPDKIVPCATGWTIDVGSSSVEQCRKYPILPAS
jgi:hypothetical protein